jgi:hypothetical protein
MSNPNKSTNSNTQSDVMINREGTRSLRIDLGTGGGTGTSASSGLSIPS